MPTLPDLPGALSGAGGAAPARPQAARAERLLAVARARCQALAAVADLPGGRGAEGRARWARAQGGRTATVAPIDGTRAARRRAVSRRAEAAPVDVALADGNALMLGALAEIFERDGRFSLVSTTRSAEAFLQTAVTAPTSVAVVDWSLPALGAEKLIRILREQGSAVRVVVCSHGETADIPKRAMAAGAAGFFSHSEPPERLLAGTLDVAAGKMVFPYLDVRDLHDPLGSLTRTERALLDSLALGRTNKELATDHGIAVNTVKFHLRNLYEKLSVRNRAQAIAFYYSSGGTASD